MDIYLSYYNDIQEDFCVTNGSVIFSELQIVSGAADTADLPPPTNLKLCVHLVKLFISRLQLGKTHRCYFRSVFLSSYAPLNVRS